DNEESDDDDSDDELEDLLNFDSDNKNLFLDVFKNINTDSSKPDEEVLNVTIKKNLNESNKKKNRKFLIISKEERDFRKKIHILYLVCMIIHGKIRNKWINDPMLLNFLLANFITKKVLTELHPHKFSNKKQLNGLYSRKFLDGLKRLMLFWSNIFKVSNYNSGIFKKKWSEILSNDFPSESIDFNKFVDYILRLNAGRDIAVQGFVALLRAADVNARLVFSLQPPDFTSISKTNLDLNLEMETDSLNKRKRLGLSPTPLLRPLNPYLSPYPVFWAEAWNPYIKKWITIDPVHFKIVENIVRKSKLEPPLNDVRNQLTYVIGFDKFGNIKDITRRYASNYLSKTRRKRIDRVDNWSLWYKKMLEKLSKKSNNKKSKLEKEIDFLEDLEFKKRDINEGMPNSYQDFKNHPVYALEEQLKQNEILYPKKACGTIKLKGKNKLLKVYRRENVQKLKSVRAWFISGRILKVGARTLRIRKAKPMKLRGKNFTRDFDEENEDVRLYAEFQTELYKPPPVKDGKVPKTEYGKIEVFQKSMIPEGGALIREKFAARAAKIIGVDYALAVEGFEFSGRSVTSKIPGIVVAEEYKEAVLLVCDQLCQEQIEQERNDIEMIALNAWKILINSLVVEDRLNREHGEIIEDKKTINSKDIMESDLKDN
ncbi:Rad4-domain-containing protein, partial [Ascoidea rubescens DSM 1968]